MKPVYMIVACADNRVIGKNGRLPWHIPEDAQYYLDMTEGGIVVHGRRVYEETGHAMPGRQTIVLTRDASLTFPDAMTAPSLREGLKLAQQSEHPGPVWITGGSQVYTEGLQYASRLFLTRIHRDFEGDTLFPEWNPPFTRILSERKSRQDGIPYTFYILEKEGEPDLPL